MNQTLFRDRPFTLRQLQYAVAVHQTGAFGRAADVCGVSQPSLSAQVAKLEDLLGVQLFDRLPRAVVPTAEGELLLPTMERLLVASEDLEARARAAARPGSLLLRIGVIPTVAPYALPTLSASLREEHPSITVHWIEARTADLEAQIVEGALDAAIIADPPSVGGMTCHPLCDDPFSVLVPADHALAQPIGADELDRYELLLLEEGHCLRDHALAVCREPSAIESPFRATSLATLVQMVGAGLGITIIPRSAIELEAGRAPVRVVPFRDPVPARQLRLVWRARSSRSDALERIVDTFTRRGLR